MARVENICSVLRQEAAISQSPANQVEESHAVAAASDDKGDNNDEVLQTVTRTSLRARNLLLK